MKCLFCSNKLDIVIESNLAFAIYDKYPVNKGHMLIITKSHNENYE